MQRIALVFLAFALALSLIGCGGNGTASGSGSKASGKDDPRIVDLKGREIKWYIFEYTEEQEKSTEQGLIRLQRRREIEELFNCKITILSGPNDTTVQNIQREIMSGDNTVDIVDGTAPMFVCGEISGDAFVDLNSLGVFNLDDPKWHKEVNKMALNVNGKQYGVYKKLEADEALTNNQVLYFNRRLVKNAGYNPDDIYKWQKEGTWTWAKFEEISQAVARLSTPASPIWGATDYNYLLYGSLLTSNNTNWLTLENANMTFTADNEKSLEATAFYKGLYDKKIMPLGGRDESHRDIFYEGKVGFMVDYVQRLSPSGTAKLMKDDFGLVMPPKGPQADKYISFIQWFNSFWMIPKNIKDPESLAKVIDYYCDPFYSDEADANRVLQATRETFVRDEGSLDVFGHIEKGDVFNPALMAGPVWENWITLVNSILKGEKTAAVMAKEMKPGYDGTFKDMWGLAK